MECPECGGVIHEDEQKCEACQHPQVGEAGAGPKAAGVTRPEQRPRTPWNVGVWSVVVVAVVLAAVLAILASL